MPEWAVISGNGIDAVPVGVQAVAQLRGFWHRLAGASGTKLTGLVQAEWKKMGLKLLWFSLEP